MGGFARFVFATVLESVVLGLVSGLTLGLGLESGILGLGLGCTEATFLVLASLLASDLVSLLASCRFPPTIWPASFEMTDVESAGGIGSANEISRVDNCFWK